MNPAQNGKGWGRRLKMVSDGRFCNNWDMVFPREKRNGCMKHKPKLRNKQKYIEGQE